jgi:hypothetical protein
MLGGLDRRVDGAVPAHHHHRHRQQAGARPFLEQGDAVDVGHPDVEQHQVGAHALARRAGLRRVLRQLDGVPLVAEDLREQAADAEFVVNNKDGRHTSGEAGVVSGRGRPAWGR